MKKIVHVIEDISDDYGGPARSVPLLVKGLNTIGSDNEIISTSINGTKPHNSICDENNIKVSAYAFYNKKIKFSPKLSSELKERTINADIVHCHNLWTYPAYASYAASKKNKKPLVCSIRGNLYEWNLNQSKFSKKIAMLAFQKNMLSSAAMLHATEPGEISAIRRLGIKSPVALIPNGIDFESFDQMIPPDEAKSILGLNANKKYILFMSRIHPKKGLEYLCDAFSKLHLEFNEWEMIVAGPVYDQRYLEKTLSANSSSKLKIHTLGMLSGNRRLAAFSAASLFVLPAHTENFGIAIGEAMASRLPVITTTGTPWQILNNIDAGWCVDLNFMNIHSALTSALTKNESELRCMGARGRNYIEENFSWGAVSNKMDIAYKWVSGEILTKPDFIYD